MTSVESQSRRTSPNDELNKDAEIALTLRSAQEMADQSQSRTVPLTSVGRTVGVDYRMFRPTAYEFADARYRVGLRPRLSE